MHAKTSEFSHFIDTRLEISAVIPKAVCVGKTTEHTYYLNISVFS